LEPIRLYLTEEWNKDVEQNLSVLKNQQKRESETTRERESETMRQRVERAGERERERARERDEIIEG
jgi:hypothetical protein